MESRLRMLIVLAGLPEPDVNVIFRKPDSSWLMRLDLYYAAFPLSSTTGDSTLTIPGSGIVTSPGGKPWIR